MNRNLLILLLILIFSQIIFAQNFDKTKLDRYFNELEANNKFMGSVAISKNGQIIYSKSIGYSDFENNVKANINSKYRIGSISKTFTTVLVLKAVEEKKLTLDQTIQTYFTTIKNAEKITIKQLLNHRSGIHNFTNDADYLTWHTESKSEAEMIDIIVKVGSDFEPDSKAEYSNSNFVLLSFILEKIYKKSYSEILQEKIIKPIGLTNTYFGGKIQAEKNECKSYSYSENWKEEAETDISIPLGAGGIVSTPSDLTKFSDALFGGKLLSSPSLEIMKTIKDNYGIGLFQIPFYDTIGYGHTGGIDGFSSVFSYFMGSNISYALISNGANYNTNKISIAVLSAIFEKEYEIPSFNTIELNSEDLDKYLGVYSSKEIPLKITISKEGKILKAQVTGQPSFPLEPSEKDIFTYEQAGVVIEFKPTEKIMILKQGGGKFTFTKE